MNILYYPIVVPLAFGVAILVLPRMLKETLAIIGSAAALYYGAVIVLAGEELVAGGTWLDMGDFALSTALRADTLSSFILVVSTVITLLVVIFSVGSMRGADRAKEYHAFVLMTSGGAAAAILADSLLVLLVGWEITTVLLFFLVTMGGDGARAAAGKSFVMVGLSDNALLLGILLVWGMTGASAMSDVRAVPLDSGWLVAAYILFAASAMIKAGAIPGHTWIPEAAGSAPASVMAFLPASLDKLLGIYLLVRVSCQMFVPTPAIRLALLVIGAATIIGAVMMAVVQHRLKKLLAFHAVSQVGYMVMGIGTGTALGIIGALFHMLNNVLYKSCLFLGAGAIEKRTGTDDLDRLGGLAHVMPVTFWTMLAASLAISGVPPFNGFVSKWLIYQGTIEAGRPVFLVAAMFGSALTLASFVKVMHALFMGKTPGRFAHVRPAGPAMGIPMVVLALSCILLGVFAQWPLRHVFGPIAGVAFPGIPGALMPPRALWSPTLATLLILAALAGGWLIAVAGRLMKVRSPGIFVGGEALDEESSHYPGTGFYETIRAMRPLGTLYADAEKGVYDLYVLGGTYGSRLIGVFRAMHDGVVSTYVAFALVGLVFLLFTFIM